MSDIENKTWILSRIENNIDHSIEDFKSMEDKFEKIRSDEREKIFGKRNNIFSVLGVLLTIILALYSTEKIEDELFLWLLFSGIIIGAIIFIISNLFLKHTTSAFIFIENQMVESINNISKLSGFINLHSANRENLSDEFLQSFLFFSYFIGASELMKIKKGYKLASQVTCLTKFSKDTFILNYNDLENVIKPTLSKLEKFEPHQNIPRIWYEPAKKIIDEYVQNTQKS